MPTNIIPTILAIDTSCDDTAAAVTRGLTVLSNVVASQTELHRPYGGVFPTVAKQAHRENIEPTVALALKRAQLDWSEIDALAVTIGPGLAPALEVGINYAKQLAATHHLPMIAVNHLEGHLLSVLAQPHHRSRSLSNPSTGHQLPATDPQPDNQLPGLNYQSPARQSSSLQLPTLTPELDRPVLGVIVSGGHSEFILVNQIGEYQRLGWTIDDAAGECLDKVGRLLSLGYPAGPVIEELAKRGNENKYPFPLPMTSSGDYNLSFSGLKTFARNLIEQLEAKQPLSKQITYDLCASLQKAVFRHITYKLGKILKDQPALGQVWLGGGVAANSRLRARIRATFKEHRQDSANQSRSNKPAPASTQRPAPNSQRPALSPQHPALSPQLLVPYTKKLCADNAAMIGVAAQFKYAKKEVAVDLNQIERQPNWQLDRYLDWQIDTKL